MGSKINTNYWGANVDPATIGGYTMSYGVSSNNIRTLIANGAYNPNTDSFDYSVSPWGIGYSAAGNRGQIVLLRNGSRDGAAPGVFTKIMFDGMDKENSNRPFALINKNHYFRDSFRWLQSRVGGDITVDDSNYMKNAAVTYSSEYLSNNSTSNGCLSLAKVATYLDYQKYKLRVTGFIYINLDTGAVAGFNFRNVSETVEEAKTRFNNFSFPEHMAIVGIKVDMMGYAAYSGSPTGWTDSVEIGAMGNGIQLRGHSIGSCINFNQLTVTADEETKFKLCFTWNLGIYNNSYDSDTYASIPYRYWSTDTAAQCFPIEGMNYRTGGQPTFNRIQVNGLGFSTDDHYGNTNMAGNFCDKEQSFSDITYKQRPLLYRVVNSQLSEVREGDAVIYNTYQYYRLTSIYEVVNSDTFTKAQILALIKHEVAFYGFQFYISWGDANGGTWSVGDNDLFLPVFDEHLITTGNYLSGTSALTAPNASWGNVFDDNMPVYDYEYNPEPNPSPSIPDEDSGYLDQRTYHGYHMQGSNKYYALNETELIQLIAEINGLYADTSSAPDPTLLDTLQKQVAVNFKGSNPADYIVGIYGYPFGIPHVATSSPVMIGPVGTSISASIVESQAVGAMTFGSITIPYVGNFLDYAPYTQMQLYLPMLGTVDLDPAFYTGHEVSIEYVYDINSGSLSGVVYRDNIIDKIVDGSLCAQVPVTARNMGDYQNNLHQMKMALVNSALSGVQNSFGLFTEGAKSVQGSMGGDSPLAGMSMSSIDIFAVPFNAGQGVNNALYAIEHSVPKLATTSTASSNNAMQFDFTPVLFIKRASMLPEYDSELYGHTVGFACCLNKIIGDMSGLTVATNIDTSNVTTANGQALTADEINAIKQAFSNGVYV